MDGRPFSNRERSMNVTYTPQVCRNQSADGKKKKPTFKGVVILKQPTFDEKYSYMEECGFDLDESGSVGAAVGKLKSIRKMVGLSKKHYVKVELERLSDSKAFKSFDDLQYEAECDAILIEIASQVVSGFRVGNA